MGKKLFEKINENIKKFTLLFLGSSSTLLQLFQWGKQEVEEESRKRNIQLKKKLKLLFFL
ncbi:hypothetical protein BpHYR1_035655 [Brachionus plicatilis]|uniref:Uncharacterized protein n=1 Tax=Brachionus plicatilis TaxID=10195 RepID=A0A3M7RMZ2_BRAPC|nr:hypothetical protein BpHYR1_035655 [Brachionus plicatilis]